MDTELIKAIGSVLGGLLTLAGGAFAFVNGRLRDASTEDDRRQLLDKAANWIALTPIFVAVLFMLLGAKYYVAVIFFVMSYVLQARIFLIKPNFPSRAEILAFSILSAITVASIVFALTGGFLEKVINVQARILQIQNETTLLQQKR